MGIGALSIGYEAEGGSHTPKPRKPDFLQCCQIKNMYS